MNTLNLFSFFSHLLIIAGLVFCSFQIIPVTQCSIISNTPLLLNQCVEVGPYFSVNSCLVSVLCLIFCSLLYTSVTHCSTLTHLSCWWFKPYLTRCYSVHSCLWETLLSVVGNNIMALIIYRLSHIVIKQSKSEQTIILCQQDSHILTPMIHSNTVKQEIVTHKKSQVHSGAFIAIFNLHTIQVETHGIWAYQMVSIIISKISHAHM